MACLVTRQPINPPTEESSPQWRRPYISRDGLVHSPTLPRSVSGYRTAAILIKEKRGPWARPAELDATNASIWVAGAGDDEQPPLERVEDDSPSSLTKSTLDELTKSFAGLSTAASRWAASKSEPKLRSTHKGDAPSKVAKPVSVDQPIEALGTSDDHAAFLAQLACSFDRSSTSATKVTHEVASPVADIKAPLTILASSFASLSTSASRWANVEPESAPETTSTFTIKGAAAREVAAEVNDNDTWSAPTPAKLLSLVDGWGDPVPTASSEAATPSLEGGGSSSRTSTSASPTSLRRPPSVRRPPSNTSTLRQRAGKAISSFSVDTRASQAQSVLDTVGPPDGRL
jgi:hypothetical protein